MVKYLCEIAKLIRSSYYWKIIKTIRYKKYEQDNNDFKLLHQIYIEKNVREEIKMALEIEYEILMNHKKIRKIFRMHGIIFLIRKAKPYKKL